VEQRIGELISGSVCSFCLPRYREIPNVGLYLEQVTKYIGDCLLPLEGISITGSMISNYVKRGLVLNPVKKQYDRDQIAYLIFIAVAKTVLSMDDIRLMVNIQRETYDNQVAYDYFCCEFECVLQAVFSRKNVPDTIGVENTDEKIMLRNTIIAVAHKVYLDRLFAMLHTQGGEK